MIKAKEDLTGRTFGNLTVLEREDDYICSNGERKTRWLCKCNCDNQTMITVHGVSLKNGSITSCGCVKKEKNRNTTNVYDLNLEDEHGLYGIGYCYNTGRAFYFDMEDYDKIKDYNWKEHYNKENYSRPEARDKKLKRTVKIHNVILGTYYDHIDKNAFNNRKYNLRKCTIKENTRNSTIRSTNKTGFIGVYLTKAGTWNAGITVDWKTINLGTFKEKEDAIRARLEAEAKYFGEFAPQQHLFEQYKINVEESDTNDLS